MVASQFMSTAAQSDGKVTGDAGAGAQGSAAPPKDGVSPDVLAARAEADQYKAAAVAAADKATKLAGEFEAYKKHTESPDYAKEMLGKALGIEKKVDPVQELASIKAANAAAQAEADRWKNTAITTSRVNKVQSVLLGLPEFDPEAVAEASSHRFFSDVEIGEDLNVKDAEALKAKAAAFMAGPGKWFKKTAAPTGDASKPAAVGAYSDPARGPPLPTGKAPPAPGTNGQPPRIEINEANFLDAMGLGPNAIPHNQFKASNKAS